MARQGEAKQRKVRHSSVAKFGTGRLGWARHDRARLCKARHGIVARYGLVWYCGVRIGRVWHGRAGSGAVTQGKV